MEVFADFALVDAAGRAFVILMDPERLLFLSAGALLGLIFGILPGIGGLTGTALLLPFTFAMDPYTAFAFLLGLASTTATGDPIPAVMFGVPGGAGSAATVLDGLPMAKRGEAGRALSASYMSSLLGGLFGAAIIALTVPLLRPLMLFIGSPELLALAVLGISMVAVLSGRTPLRGVAAACFGLMLAMVGSDPQTDTPRWTMGTLYLWDGLPLVPVVLGLFALPELCDLAVTRSSIATGDRRLARTTGMWRGARDCFTHWWLVLRCSWLGVWLGAVPGIGGAIIDWIAYGHALRTEKGAARTFGTGDVRGVIASESANNAKEGGALVPTVAFGVPGSAGMAILLGAFMIHGLVPGPEMLGKNLDVTYSMIWSIALANILGAGLCYLFSAQFALLATLRFSLILPCVLVIIYVGAFEGSRQWGDLYALLIFGVIGWGMKQMKWPRPPLILGLVLGETVERYLFISIERYDFDWLGRPIVLAIFALALYGLVRPLFREFGRKGAKRAPWGPVRPEWNMLAGLFLLAVLGTMLAQSFAWKANARIVPIIVGSIGLLACLASLANQALRPQPAAARLDGKGGLHMDLAADTDGMAPRLVARRAMGFFLWLAGFILSMATIGLIPTVPLFVCAYMRIEGRERWRLVLPQAIGLTLFVYVVFERLLHIPWPATLLGGLFPALKMLPSV